MIAMEKTDRFKISWQEIIQIGKELYQVHGEKVDLHELILNEINSPTREELAAIKQEAIPKRNSNERNNNVNGGIKATCSKLFGIRKTSSSPAP